MALSKIDTAGIGDNAITSDKILSGAVSAADIEDSTITAAKLYSTLDLSGKTITMPSNSIGSGNISDGAITDGKLASTLDLSGKTVTYGLSGTDLPTGSILQVVSTEKTDQFTTTSNSFIDVTGMSATITPSSTSSKILVIFSVGLVGNSTGGQSVYLQLVRDTTAISIGDTAGNRPRISAGNGGDQSYDTSSLTITNLDSPSTTSAVTYKIQIKTQNVGTAKFNSRGDDSDTTSQGRTSASITLMEVAG